MPSDFRFSVFDFRSSEFLEFVARVDRPQRAGREGHAFGEPLLGGLAAAGARRDEAQGEERAAVDGREAKGGLEVLGGLDGLVLVEGGDGETIEILEAGLAGGDLVARGLDDLLLLLR